MWIQWALSLLLIPHLEPVKRYTIAYALASETWGAPNASTAPDLDLISRVLRSFDKLKGNFEP